MVRSAVSRRFLLWPVLGLAFLAFGLFGRHHASPSLDRLAATTSGTTVCGTLSSGQTTWSAAASPYAICADGVTVPSDATLVLDGSAGPVFVQAQGSGGITVAGALRTTGTSSTNSISLGGMGRWNGLTVDRGGTVDLDHVGVTGAATGITATDPVGFRVSNSAVSDAGADGISLSFTQAPPSVPTLSGDTITRAARYGLAVHGPSGGTTPLHLQNTRVGSSGVASDASRAPAVLLDGVTGTYGTGGDIADISGGGNGIDGVAWSGTATPTSGPLTWPTVTASVGEHTLGLLPLGLRVDSDVVVPAGGIVKAWHGARGDGLDIHGALTAAAGSGAAPVFSPASMTDTGAVMCPSTLVAAPCGSGRQHIAITAPAGKAVILTGVHARGTEFAVSSADAVTISGSSFDFYCAFGVSSPTTIDRSTFKDADISSSGPSLTLTNSTVDGAGYVFTSAGSLTVDNSSFDGPTVRAVSGPQGGLATVSITHSAFRHGVPGVYVQGHATFDATTGRSTFAPHVTMQDDTFTENDFVSPKPDRYHQVPVELRDVRVSLGPNGSVARLSGADNAVNAIGLSGEEDGSFTWVSPSTSSGSHPLGYATIGTLNVVGPGTVTVPAGAVVKGYGMQLIGASLDATAGGASFVPLKDDSVGPIMCPSANLFSETYCPDEPPFGGINWTAISLVPGPATHQNGTLAITGATAHQARLGDYGESRLYAGGESGGGMTVVNSTLTDTQVRLTGGAVTIRGTTISSGLIAATDGPVVVASSSISCPILDPGSIGCDGQVAGDRDAISVTEATDQSVSITDTTTTRGSISVRSATSGALLDHVTLRHVTVTNDSEQFGPPVAVDLLGVKVRVGSGLDVDDVGGYANEQDLMRIEGEIDGSFTWPGIANATTRHPLGVVSTNSLAGLTLVGPGTVTVPANALIKASVVHLRGVTFDATAGGATFAGVGDASVGPVICTQPNYCAQAPAGGDLTIDTDPAAMSTVLLNDAHLYQGSLRVSGLDGQTHLRWTGGTGDSLAVSTDGVAAELRSVDFRGTHLNLAHSSGNVLDHLNLQRRNGNALTTTAAAAAVTSSVFDQAEFYGPFREQSAIESTDSASNLSLTCDEVVGNPDGGVYLRGPGTVTDSDLYSNPYVDVRADGPAVPASGNWWGAPGDAAARVAGNVTVRNSATAQHPSATIALSGNAVATDGSVHDGTLVVGVTTSRRMDSTVPLQVTLSGPDNKAHTVAGTWVDGTHWSGSYTVSNSTASNGGNTVRAAAGRGCVPDPDTNLLIPAALSAQVNMAPPPVSAVTVSGAAARTTKYGATVSITGTATPGCPVGVWFRQAGTATFVKRRTLTASSAGAWSTTYVANDDYRVYATCRTAQSAQVLVQVAPTINGAATRTVKKKSTVTLTGTGLPGQTLTLHFHKAGTAANDYSIVRSVSVTRTGSWSRAFVADVDYRIYATLPNAQTSPTVLVQAR